MSDASVFAIYVNQTAAADESFLRILAERAHRLGHTVLLIRPADVGTMSPSTKRNTMRAERWDATRRTWRSGEVALPHVVYNRCFYEDHRVRRLLAERALRRLLRRSRARLLQRNVPGKWRIHRLLYTLPAFRPWRHHLPQTARVQNVAHVLRALRLHRRIIIKPTGGSHGRAVILLRALQHGDIQISGRDRNNQPFQRTFHKHENTGLSARQWLRQYLDGRPHLVQQALRLIAMHGAQQTAPFDVRAFVRQRPEHKNAWQLIGCGVRCGAPGGLTSNLHGGGHAHAARTFLQTQFGAAQATRILQELESLAVAVAAAIGSRLQPLIELGLDFGIDRTGHIWLIEVNGKPGRELFMRLGQRDVYEQTVHNVVQHIPHSKRRFRPF
jgi:hypothetical protein